ncbi:MAG: hypothetical protein ACRDHM_00190 [Actinomycetota bacterium]
MRPLLLPVLALSLVGCTEDNPTVAPRPQGRPDPQTSADWAVTAVEYEFQGAPVLLSAGEFTFTLENEGEEPHELYLFYITGDQPIEELIELPERQVDKVAQAVNRAEAKPGGSDEFTAALVPGRFGYVCFVEAEDGTPHAFLGMRGEFTVA